MDFTRLRLLLLLLIPVSMVLIVSGKEVNQLTLLSFILIYLPSLAYMLSKINAEKRIVHVVSLAVLIVTLSAILPVYPQKLNADYRAYLNVSSNLTLNESYVYHVRSGDFHTLCRNFMEKLVVYPSGLSYPECYVELLKVNADSFAKYAVDYRGKVYVWPEESKLEELVKSKNRRNEAGIVSLTPIPKGDYTVNYSFLLHPEELSGSLVNVKLKLAEKHIPYNSVRIHVHSDGRIVKLYPLFPDSKVVRKGNEWIISGKARKDERIEIDLILNRKVNGYVENVSNVKNIEEFDYSYYRLFSNFSGYIRSAGIAAVFLSLVFPAVPYAVSRIYGERGERERRDKKERTARKIPNAKRKPWEVNLLFKGDAISLDENGVIATLLDLERRGYIRVGRKVQVLKSEGKDLDRFERELLKSLKSGHGIKRVLYFAGDLKDLRESKVNEVLDLKGYKIIKKVFYVTLIISVAFTAIYYFWKPYGAGFMLALAGMSVLTVSAGCVFSPVQLFSRWKEEAREEKEEWMEFLSRFSNLELKNPELKDTEPKDTELEEAEEEAEELEMIYAIALGHSLGKHPKFLGNLTDIAVTSRE